MHTHPDLAGPNPVRSSAPPPLRLELKPAVATTRWVDGVWWPRSTDLVGELPSLMAAAAARIGGVVLVGYHFDAWDSAPAQIDLVGGSVALQGFIFEDPNSVVVVLVGSTGRRLTLKVLPPQTTSASADQAFDEALRPANGTGDPDDAAGQDTDRSLDEVATRLVQFDGTREPERVTAIAQLVSEAAEQFVDAPVQAYVPILVEHIVRQKLTNRIVSD